MYYELHLCCDSEWIILSLLRNLKRRIAQKIHLYVCSTSLLADEQMLKKNKHLRRKKETSVGKWRKQRETSRLFCTPWGILAIRKGFKSFSRSLRNLSPQPRCNHREITKKTHKFPIELLVMKCIVKLRNVLLSSSFLRLWYLNWTSRHLRHQGQMASSSCRILSHAKTHKQ